METFEVLFEGTIKIMAGDKDEALNKVYGKLKTLEEDAGFTFFNYRTIQQTKKYG